MSNNCFISSHNICSNGINCPKCSKKYTERKCHNNIENIKRINNQTRTFGSLGIYRNKALQVSKTVGWGASSYFNSVGGPGDKKQSIEGLCSKCSDEELKKVTYRLPITKTRVSNKGKKGVDIKHNSYDRYLARRVGGVLRNEKIKFNTYYTKTKDSSGACICYRCGACFNGDQDELLKEYVIRIDF